MGYGLGSALGNAEAGMMIAGGVALMIVATARYLHGPH